jgi:hypothetical protein
MSLNPLQLDQLTEWFRSQIEVKKEIDHFIEILLGDVCGIPPANLQKLLHKCGISEEQYSQMTPDEKIKTFKLIRKEQPTSTDNLIAALDMIFELRYGWPEGTAARMRLVDVFIALEHATEHDDPSKPSIWDITK